MLYAWNQFNIVCQLFFNQKRRIGKGGQKNSYCIMEKLVSDVYKRCLNNTKDSDLFSLHGKLVYKFWGHTDHLLDIGLGQQI